MGRTIDSLPRMADLAGSLTRFTNWLRNFSAILGATQTGAGATVTFTTTAGVITAVTAAPAAAGAAYPANAIVTLPVTGGGGANGFVLAYTNAAGAVTKFVLPPGGGGTGYADTVGAATGIAYLSALATIGGVGVAGPPATGLTLVAAIEAAWVAAYALAINIATRTHTTIVAAKVLRFGTPDVALALTGAPGGLVGGLRILIRQIQAAGYVPPDLLAKLGLSPHIRERAIPQVPLIGPELTISPGPPHTLVIRYHQEGAREDSRAKPAGCKGVLLKWRTSGGASGSAVFTKNPCTMDVGAALSGQRISITGAWMMGNSKNSPAGNTVNCGVP